MPGINVFTTNPKYYNMLSINPFAFHEEVHVLEHLDRLIEIFTGCDSGNAVILGAAAHKMQENRPMIQPGHTA